MYRLQWIDEDGNKQIQEYSTKQESVYYKKKSKFKCSIVADYTVTDLETHMLAESHVIEAQSAKEAVQRYLKLKGEDAEVERDLRNIGRFVVSDRGKSYVFNVH